MIFKDFRLDELFDIVGTKSLDAGHLCFVENGVNFVARIRENNGVQGKIEKQILEPNEANTITATVIGNYKYAKLQEDEYYCSQNINKLTPKLKNLSKYVMLYFVTCIQKFISKWDGQQGGYKLEDIKNHIISLPTSDGITPDYKYMESFISKLEKEKINELEQERLSELDKYLKATGLNDYRLSNEDIQILNKLVNKKSIKIGDIFDIKTGRDVIINTLGDGNIPLISHQCNNNGITKNIKKLPNRILFNYKSTLPLADRGVFHSTCQNKDFHIGTRVKALIFKDGEKTEKQRLYMVNIINKLQSQFADYLTNATDKLPDLEINIPVTLEGKPDYDYMEKYITAIEKLTINDIIEYKDKIIKTLKQICNI